MSSLNPGGENPRKPRPRGEPWVCERCKKTKHASKRYPKPAHGVCGSCVGAAKSRRKLALDREGALLATNAKDAIKGFEKNHGDIAVLVPEFTRLARSIEDHDARYTLPLSLEEIMYRSPRGGKKKLIEPEAPRPVLPFPQANPHDLAVSAAFVPPAQVTPASLKPQNFLGRGDRPAMLTPAPQAAKCGVDGCVMLRPCPKHRTR